MEGSLLGLPKKGWLQLSPIVNFPFLSSNIFPKKVAKKVGEKSRECHNHKPQPFPDPKNSVT